MTQPTDQFKVKVFGKKLHSAIAPEDIKLNDKYSFSINPKECIYNKKESLKDKILVLRDLISNFKLPGISLKMVMEMSSIGKLHAHGMVIFEDNIGIAMFYNELFNIRNITGYELDTISGPETWNNYCIKGTSYMMSYSKAEKVKHYLKF